MSGILVLNCGSSSVKYSLYQNNELISQGLGERIGATDATLTIKIGQQKNKIELKSGDHQDAINVLIEELSKAKLLDQLKAVGHRVVHGGEDFSESIIVNEEVLQAIKNNNRLAPLHNPANVLGIELMQQQFPQLPQVAVFDTAFHQSLPDHAYRYALPNEYYQDLGVRKYGFHGTSFRIVNQLAQTLLKENNLPHENMVIAHLGNGSSACAVSNNKSVDTTMGLTPLEGLMMGTRCGDIDPSLHLYLANQLDLSLEQVTDVLNKKSGLLGVSGISNDMRTVLEAADNGNVESKLAVEMFCFKLAKHIGALMVSLPRLDALVFTGGIGENSAIIREKTCQHLAVFGLQIDGTLNFGQALIQSPNSQAAIAVVSTDEEWQIAQDCLTLI